MKTLAKKLKNKKGFTLMEMLIVVAIMVILVAVSIPVFTSQLDNAKETTDDANVRAAKSMALTEYMTSNSLAGQTIDGSADVVAYYDIVNGKLLDKDSKPSNTENKGQSTAHKNQVITITWKKATKDIEVDWAN